jgi:hypothetical protein
MKPSKKIRPKRKKLPSISSLEKKADAVFSQYIRLRDADEGGTVSCVTCQKLLFWKEAHCGHFIKRGNRAVRYDEKNCNSQCPRCNHFLGGNDAVYAVFIIDRYGRETYDELMAARGKECKRYRSDYLELIEAYQNKVKELG